MTVAAAELVVARETAAAQELVDGLAAVATEGASFTACQR
jgi:hypothetical protein